LSATNAHVHAGLFGAFVLSRARRLGALLACHVILLGC
jgi:hypothetical protein